MDTTSSFNSTKEPGSWKEAIQALEHSKKHLPWNPAEVAPIVRISFYERKREEREVDPLTLKYRDPVKQAAYQAKRDERMNARLSSSMEQLNNTLNIITHTGPPRRADMVPRLNTKSSHRDFNFITNMKVEDHTNAPLLYDEAYTIQMVKNAKPHRASTSHAPVRDYNMISNDYYVDNEDRKASEFRKLKESLTKKYWDTHNYDPVKGRYYDDGKEEQFLSQRETLSEVHGTAFQQKLPPSVQYCDGNSFDILTHDVKDESRLKATTVMEDRQLNRRLKGKSLDVKMRDAGIADWDKKEERRKHRAKYDRWEKEAERGYNILTTQVTLESTTPAPLPPKPKAMWDRITMTLPGAAAPILPATTSARAATPSREELRSELAAPPSNRIRNLSGGNPAAAPASSGLRLGSAPTSSLFVSGYVQSSSTPALPRVAAAEANPATGRSTLESHRSSDGIRFASNGGRPTAPSGHSRPVPSLDLTKNEFGENVNYSEPVFGGKGLAVPMVRTGIAARE